jgi:parvulin-like peptidyl-prolyl isomerase
MFSDVVFGLKADGAKHKVESEYGVHNVQIINRIKPEIKAFEMVKENLKDDYLKLLREEKNRQTFEALKAQYTISLEEK